MLEQTQEKGRRATRRLLDKLRGLVHSLQNSRASVYRRSSGMSHTYPRYGPKKAKETKEKEGVYSIDQDIPDSYFPITHNPDRTRRSIDAPIIPSDGQCVRLLWEMQEKEKESRSLARGGGLEGTRPHHADGEDDVRFSRLFMNPRPAPAPRTARVSNGDDNMRPNGGAGEKEQKGYPSLEAVVEDQDQDSPPLIPPRSPHRLSPFSDYYAGTGSAWPRPLSLAHRGQRGSQGRYSQQHHDIRSPPHPSGYGRGTVPGLLQIMQPPSLLQENLDHFQVVGGTPPMTSLDAAAAATREEAAREPPRPPPPLTPPAWRPRLQQCRMPGCRSIAAPGPRALCDECEADFAVRASVFLDE